MAMMIALPIMAQNVKKDELPALIADILKKNPEMIIEALQALEEKNNKQSENNQAQLIKKFVSDKNAISIGNKNADIVISEFYDYNCGYCKKQFSDLQKLLREDGNIKLILIDFPILIRTIKL